MKKNMLFLSAAITTFILVILAALLFKARGGFGSPADVAAAAPTATVTQSPTDTPQPTNTATQAPTASPFITPQEAAFIAANAIGNTKIYSVDTVTRYGLDVYQVNFSGGNIVFVSPEGHILAITQLQEIVAAPPVPTQSPSSNHPASKEPDDSGGD